MKSIMKEEKLLTQRSVTPQHYVVVGAATLHICFHVIAVTTSLLALGFTFPTKQQGLQHDPSRCI